MKAVIMNETNAVIEIGEIIDYWDNGYPIVKNSAGSECAFPPDNLTFAEIDSIPEDFQPIKYCYTEEKGFYKNPNWVEPDATNIFGISDEVYRAIKEQAVQEVRQEVQNGTV